jgi:hypothetical protein
MMQTAPRMPKGILLPPLPEPPVPPSQALKGCLCMLLQQSMPVLAFGRIK